MASVVVELSGDEARLIASLNRTMAAMNKVEGKLKDTKKASEGFNFDKAVSSLSQLALGWAGINTAVQTVTSSIEAQIAKQEVAFAKAQKTAEAQAGAAGNLADMNPAVARKFFEQAPRIAKATGVADANLLVAALGESYGVAGSQEGAVEAVLASARLNALNPMAIGPTAAAGLDLKNAIGGGASVEETIGLLATTGLRARIPSQKALAESLAPVVGIAAATAPGQDPRQEGRAAAALLATISQQITDTTGAESATASKDFIANVAKFFGEEGRVDPGTFRGRVGALTNDAALQKEFLAKPFGSAGMQVLTKQFFDVGSQFRKGFESSYGVIGFDQAAYDRVQGLSTGATFAQRAAVAGNQVTAAVDAAAMTDTSVFGGAVGKIASDALTQTRGGIIRGTADAIADSFGRVWGSQISSPTARAEYETMRLQERRDEVLRYEGNTPQGRANVAVIDQAIAGIRELHTELIRDMRNVFQSQQQSAPAPNNLRAQAAAGAKQ